MNNIRQRAEEVIIHEMVFNRLFIQQDGLLSGKLALKGGTAINLTVFDLPRLSVDIDLDYVGSIGREQMMEDRGSIRDRIGKYITSAALARCCWIPISSGG